MQSVGNQQYNDAHVVKLTGTNAYCTLITPTGSLKDHCNPFLAVGNVVLSVPVTEM